MTTEIFTLALARAQRTENLSPQVYNVLSSIATHMKRQGSVTIPKLAINLGISFNAVQMHLHRSPHLFKIEKSNKRRPGINMISITDEAIALMVRINEKTKRYADQIEQELQDSAA